MEIFEGNVIQRECGFHLYHHSHVEESDVPSKGDDLAIWEQLGVKI